MDRLGTIAAVVITYNAESKIRDCLDSLLNQTVPPFEIIVVDCGSTDNTLEILDRYGVVKHVTQKKGFAVQRNIGANLSSSSYLIFIDADMILPKKLFEECLYYLSHSYDSLVVPERFVGTGFWGHVRSFERTFYDSVTWIEGARWFRRDVFFEIGGYDESLPLGEEWSLDESVRSQYRVGRAKHTILCAEGELRLRDLLRKKAYYVEHSSGFDAFRKKHPERASKVLSPLLRASLFLQHPLTLARHPLLSLGLLLLGGGELAVNYSPFLRTRLASDPWKKK